MDYQKFGEQLKTLRQRAGISQTQLADKLQLIALAASPETYRVVDASLISKWERAKQRNKRPWKPTHQYMIYLIQIFVDQLDVEQARDWATQAGYQVSEVILQDTFAHQPSSVPTTIPTSPRPMQHPPLPDSYVHRPDLETTILQQLQTQQIVVLRGLGGSGKSSLAVSVADQVADSFSDGVIWVDDCLQADHVYQVMMAQDRIASAFQVTLRGQSLSERAAQLRSLMWGKNCLIVLDDVWDTPGLEHLMIHRDPSRLLITTRQPTIAYTFGCPGDLEIGGFTPAEGQNLLGQYLFRARPDPAASPQEMAELFDTANVEGIALLERVGYLPLGVDLLRTLLQSGHTPTTLLEHFDKPASEEPSATDFGLAQTQLRSLNTCFDLSYDALPDQTLRRYFAQLSCFSGTLRPEALPQIWQVEPNQVGGILYQLTHYTLLNREADRYRLHPLVRYYARQKLATNWSAWNYATFQRYTHFLIKRVIYHPQLLPEVADTAPNVDPYWADIVACLTWAAEHKPALVTWAVLLAHTERAALLDAVGEPLLAAMMTHIPTTDPTFAQPLLTEQLGTLYLLQGDLDQARTTFAQSATLWELAGNYLAQARLLLRQAAIFLLQENQPEAAALARQAQSHLNEIVPVHDAALPAARQLFYWFNMIYLVLVRWPELPQADVAALADLARRTGDEHLMARGLHVYRVWCTTIDVERSAEIRALGQTLSAEVVAAWQACGEIEKAESEALWATYAQTREMSLAAAEAYARRISKSTPWVNPNQLQVIDSPGIRWWLQTPEAERIERLSQLLLPYFKTENSPTPWLEPDSEEWVMVRDIIGIRGALEKTSRRFVLADSRPPDNHFLYIPEWRVFSGQRMLSLTDHGSADFVHHLLSSELA